MNSGVSSVKRFALTGVLAAALAGLCLAAAAEQDAGPRIYPHLAAELIEMGDVLVIDVRSDQEVEETGVLADAVHVVHTETGELIEAIGEDTGRPVVLYCGTGRRAGMAIDALREAGYTGLVNAGGYEDLRQALEAAAEEDG